MIKSVQLLDYLFLYQDLGLPCIFFQYTMTINQAILLLLPKNSLRKKKQAKMKFMVKMRTECRELVLTAGASKRITYSSDECLNLQAIKGALLTFPGWSALNLHKQFSN